jgi:hypothetical protein
MTDRQKWMLPLNQHENSVQQYVRLTALARTIR